MAGLVQSLVTAETAGLVQSLVTAGTAGLVQSLVTAGMAELSLVTAGTAGLVQSLVTAETAGLVQSVVTAGTAGLVQSLVTVGTAGLVQSLVTAETAVLDVCKPGARLLGVVEGSQPPPPGSCRVLIAGANDIGAGQSSTIYHHLENQITLRTGTAKVMISTYCHNLLPSHPVNQQTTLLTKGKWLLAGLMMAAVIISHRS
ncbi:hypothetical protein J6590_070847 [Homalodisca vitripennis]|nr:hypothetical protein J6590_070847 [Homalodisca vitripennis]